MNNEWLLPSFSQIWIISSFGKRFRKLNSLTFSFESLQLNNLCDNIVMIAQTLTVLFASKNVHWQQFEFK